MPGYGLWTLAVVNAAFFIFFAWSFYTPLTTRDWRSFGLFSAFVVALFAEMYGFPLSLYLLSGWLSSRFPEVNWQSHDAGHVLEMMFGWRSNPHFGPFHILSFVLIGGGFWLLARAWPVLYNAQRRGELGSHRPVRPREASAVRGLRADHDRLPGAVADLADAGALSGDAGHLLRGWRSTRSVRHGRASAPSTRAIWRPYPDFFRAVARPSGDLHERWSRSRCAMRSFPDRRHADRGLRPHAGGQRSARCRGVHNANANFATGVLEVRFDRGLADVAAITAAIRDCGFHVSGAVGTDAQSDHAPHAGQAHGHHHVKPAAVPAAPALHAARTSRMHTRECITAATCTRRRVTCAGALLLRCCFRFRYSSGRRWA